jgi:hypothetical protein
LAEIFVVFIGQQLVAISSGASSALSCWSTSVIECSWGIGVEAKMRVPLSGNEREQRALGAARKEGFGFEEITASIARELGEQWDDLKNRSGRPARSLAIVLSRRHTALTLREIGERCGGSDYAAVSQAHHRMDARLRNNARLAGIAASITKHPRMSYAETRPRFGLPERRLLKGDLGAIRSELALEEHMIVFSPLSKTAASTYPERLGDSSIPLWSWNSPRCTQNDRAFVDGTRVAWRRAWQNASVFQTRLK